MLNWKEGIELRELHEHLLFVNFLDDGRKSYPKLKYIKMIHLYLILKPFYLGGPK